MQSERAARLAEAVSAMPDGPSRDRFLAVLGELEAADAAGPPAGGGASDAGAGATIDGLSQAAAVSSAADPDISAAAVFAERALGAEVFDDQALGFDQPSARDVVDADADADAAEHPAGLAAHGAPSWADDAALAADTSALGVEDLFGAPEAGGRIPVIPAEPAALPDKPKRRWGRRA